VNDTNVRALIEYTGITQVDKMRDEWKKLRKEVENAQEQMNATTNTTLYDDNKKIYNEKVKQLERLTKLIRENQRNVNTVKSRTRENR
jgi:hypothetical protein